MLGVARLRAAAGILPQHGAASAADAAGKYAVLDHHQRDADIRHNVIFAWEHGQYDDVGPDSPSLAPIR